MPSQAASTACGTQAIAASVDGVGLRAAQGYLIGRRLNANLTRQTDADGSSADS
jgi:2,4-dienoyl-CoA reductase-like NADH-dependent reductase (Old Yellow Enzyme family)